MQDRLTLTDAACDEHLRRIQSWAKLKVDLGIPSAHHRLNRTGVARQNWKSSSGVQRQNHHTELIRRTAELDELSQNRTGCCRIECHATAGGTGRSTRRATTAPFEVQGELEDCSPIKLESERCRQAELEEELLRAACRARDTRGNRHWECRIAAGPFGSLFQWVHPGRRA